MALASAIHALLATLVLLATASTAVALDCPNIVRISVLHDGGILLDGAKTTIDALDKRLTELERANGVVWYYRERPDHQPTAKQNDAVRNVMDLIMKHRRPISFSSKPDFSDVVDGDGNTSPRTKC
jgi:hypothetical protein